MARKACYVCGERTNQRCPICGRTLCAQCKLKHRCQKEGKHKTGKIAIAIILLAILLVACSVQKRVEVDETVTIETLDDLNRTTVGLYSTIKVVNGTLEKLVVFRYNRKDHWTAQEADKTEQQITLFPGEEKVFGSYGDIVEWRIVDQK